MGTVRLPEMNCHPMIPGDQTMVEKSHANTIEIFACTNFRLFRYAMAQFTFFRWKFEFRKFREFREFILFQKFLKDICRGKWWEELKLKHLTKHNRRLARLSMDLSYWEYHILYYICLQLNAYKLTVLYFALIWP